MTRQERIDRIAKALCLEPTDRGFDLERGENKWWLVGGMRGDVVLPQTHGLAHEQDALEAAEGWLASELG